MNPERRRRIEEIYHTALARAEREAFLERACAGDGTLRYLDFRGSV